MNNINPSSAAIDFNGAIWFGTKNQILKFDGSKLTCFNNVYDAVLKKQNYDPRSYDYYAEIDKIVCYENEVFFSFKGKKAITNILKYSNDKLFKIKADSSQFFKSNSVFSSIDKSGNLIITRKEYGS